MSLHQKLSKPFNKLTVRGRLQAELENKRKVQLGSAPLYHHALPDYLSKDIERIQKRALSIISPGLSYDDSLSMFNMASLEDRRIDQCEKLFDSIVSNPDHKLHHFLPPKNYCHYNLRRQRHFANPVMRTKRFSSTFVPSMCRR